MSLSLAGVWAVGVWATTVWADGVWREGAPAVVAVPEVTLYKRGRRGETAAYWQDWQDEEELLIMVAFLARNGLL